MLLYLPTFLRHLPPLSSEMEPLDLRLYEERIHSQNGEDGIVREICQRLGLDHGVFVEFGSGPGDECICARLGMEDGWQGFFWEGDPEFADSLRNRYANVQGVSCSQAWIDAESIEELFTNQGVPQDIDLLSIDIDGNDYWVWKALVSRNPKIVVIEYNATIPPPDLWVMEYNPTHNWNGTSYQGASLQSLVNLGREKGYKLVATDSRGVNAFFVREDCFDASRFLDASTEYLYSPPDYGRFHKGHPFGYGRSLRI
jgi:hypothetical protein